MSKTSILAASFAFMILGASAPAWADVPGPDPVCDGKKEGDACDDGGGKTGSCQLTGFGDELYCDGSAPPTTTSGTGSGTGGGGGSGGGSGGSGTDAGDDEGGCAMRSTGRSRTSGLLAVVLVAAGAAALRKRKSPEPRG